MEAKISELKKTREKIEELLDNLNKDQNNFESKVLENNMELFTEIIELRNAGPEGDGDDGEPNDV
jgi:hypothetical protein